MQTMLKKGETSPIKLLKALAPVYAEDGNYVSKVSALIESCDLRSFDLAKTS
jgi:flagellum-specific peptidoglycan hydrolase FlgJ